MKNVKLGAAGKDVKNINNVMIATCEKYDSTLLFCLDVSPEVDF